MSPNLYADVPTCQAVLKQCLSECTSNACQLAQAIKQDKTIRDCVGSPTTYYLHSRKVDSLAASFSGSLFVEKSGLVSNGSA